MKKVIIGLYLLAFGIIIPTHSQTNTTIIGSGTSAGTSSPVASWYNSSASESIYLGTEIGSPGEITKIAYQKNSGASSQDIALTVYMRKTTIASLSATYSVGAAMNSEYVQVFDGVLPNTTTSGWMEIELDESFPYTSTSENLAILVVGSTCISSGRPQYRYTSTQGSKLSATYNDGTIGCDGNNQWNETSTMNPVWERPNIRITKTAQLSVEENSAAANFMIYHNNGLLNLISSEENISSLKIYDLQGREIYRQENINSKAFSVADMTPNHAVLLLKITDAKNNTLIKKVVY